MDSHGYPGRHTHLAAGGSDGAAYGAHARGMDPGPAPMLPIALTSAAPPATAPRGHGASAHGRPHVMMLQQNHYHHRPPPPPGSAGVYPYDALPLPPAGRQHTLRVDPAATFGHATPYRAGTSATTTTTTTTTTHNNNSGGDDQDAMMHQSYLASRESWLPPRPTTSENQWAELVASAVATLHLPPSIAELATPEELLELHSNPRMLHQPFPRPYPSPSDAFEELVHWIAAHDPSAPSPADLAIADAGVIRAHAHAALRAALAALRAGDPGLTTVPVPTIHAGIPALQTFAPGPHGLTSPFAIRQGISPDCSSWVDGFFPGHSASSESLVSEPFIEVPDWGLLPPSGYGAASSQSAAYGWQQVDGHPVSTAADNRFTPAVLPTGRTEGTGSSSFRAVPSAHPPSHLVLRQEVSISNDRIREETEEERLQHHSRVPLPPAIVRELLDRYDRDYSNLSKFTMWEWQSMQAFRAKQNHDARAACHRAQKYAQKTRTAHTRGRGRGWHRTLS